MAIVEQLQPLDAPVVSVQLTLKEVRGLVTLLGAGVESPTLADLNLTALFTSLNMIYPEYRDCSFEWCAELSHLTTD